MIQPPNAYAGGLNTAEQEFENADPVNPPDRQFASTLANGLRLLRCFTPVSPLLSNSELAARTGLSRPSITRYTYTLIKLGYLQSDKATGQYRLGPAVISLGYPLLATQALRQVARPLMNELAQVLNCSVSMGIRDRLSIVYVETSRSSTNALIQFSDIGLRFPIASSAIGHAFLAGCDGATRQAVLNEIRVHTPQTWQKFERDLLAAPGEFELKGFCSSFGGQHPDYLAVAVPLAATTQAETTVFNCVTSIGLANRRALNEKMGPQLAAMVAKLRLLGHFGRN